MKTYWKTFGLLLVAVALLAGLMFGAGLGLQWIDAAYGKDVAEGVVIVVFTLFAVAFVAIPISFMFDDNADDGSMCP